MDEIYEMIPNVCDRIENEFEELINSKWFAKLHLLYTVLIAQTAIIQVTTIAVTIAMVQVEA